MPISRTYLTPPPTYQYDELALSQKQNRSSGIKPALAVLGLLGATYTAFNWSDDASMPPAPKKQGPKKPVTTPRPPKFSSSPPTNPPNIPVPQPLAPQSPSWAPFFEPLAQPVCLPNETTKIIEPATSENITFETNVTQTLPLSYLLMGGIFVLIPIMYVVVPRLLYYCCIERVKIAQQRARDAFDLDTYRMKQDRKWKERNGISIELTPLEQEWVQKVGTIEQWKEWKATILASTMATNSRRILKQLR